MPNPTPDSITSNQIPLIDICTLWTADTWQSKGSFDLQGVFTDKAKAIDYAKEECLYDGQTNIVIYKSKLNDYKNHEEKLFSTEYFADIKQVLPTNE